MRVGVGQVPRVQEIPRREMDTCRGRGAGEEFLFPWAMPRVVGKEQEELQVTDVSIIAPSPSYLNGDPPHPGLEQVWSQGGISQIQAHGVERGAQRGSMLGTW